MSRFMLFAALGFALGAGAAEIAGVPRDSNFNNTGGYDSTRIEAQLLIDVDKETDTIHFIRDNNDPRVVTKTYIIHDVDAYEFRDYLRQMVQAKRVGNTSLQQVYPGNAADAAGNATATVSSAEPVTPPAAQPGYNPATQLGSNTAVECLKYVDGTGLLLVSAEEYRFRDHTNGMGIDSLVEFLDKPQMGSNFGTQTFLYIPKFVPARNLLPLIQNVGMNITDVSEIWQGQDVVANDPDLNWLIFDTMNYSMPNIEKMLAQYDVPIPQVRLTITVYEIYRENDDRIGLDFQAWKNNQGVDFFSVGGRYRDNWSAAYGGALGRTGSERTSFYNFNPKWNTRYIDLIAAHGGAQVLHKGELVIRNNTPATLARTTQVFYMDKTQTAPDAVTVPDLGVGAYRLLSLIAGREVSPDYPVGKANQEQVVQAAGFGFTMTVSNASVNLDETSFDVALSNTSLIGFSSNGAPRLSDNGVVQLTVSLPHGSNRFIIGGLRKETQVTSRTGVPWLCQIPWLGYLFSTESTSVKTSDLVVVGQCQWEAPEDRPDQPARSRAVVH